MYDAVIIGAGIGGLVCGAYLAKAGRNVLIVERHHKPGGYCTSFRRGNFTFDAAAHCFGSYRTDGMMRRILQDLGAERELRVIRADPSDIVVTPGNTVSFWNDLALTVEEFQKIAPGENGKVRRFFDLLRSSELGSFPRLRKLTFKELLDDFFTDETLKRVLSLPFLGIGGLPSSQMSAFIGAKLYSEFLFDGGYYPVGGMQSLSDALAKRFKELGGELRLSTQAMRLSIHDSSVEGVVLGNGEFVPSQCVVSNCDAAQTYFQLAGRDQLDRDFSDEVGRMTPSLSNFIVYLGVNQQSLQTQHPPGSFVLFSMDYDRDRTYQRAREGVLEAAGTYAYRVAHDRSTVNLFFLAAYRSREFWDARKSAFGDACIDTVEKNSIPGLSKHIALRETATPWTLYAYTLNQQGASFGWAGIPSQLAVPNMRKPSFIRGLYLAGHWATLGGGISGAAHIGADTAKNILLKKPRQG